MTVPILFSTLLVLTTPGSLGQSIHAEEVLAAREDAVNVQQFCSSFHFNVEVKNLITGFLVPEECVTYVKSYLLNGQYDADVQAVMNQARAYARKLTVQHRKKAWILDIDETSLSNVPYYQKHSYGATPFNATQFNVWVNQATAAPLQSTLTLFNELVAAKWKVIFITGRSELQRESTTKNLVRAGYRGWAKLILKNGTFLSAESYKSSVRAELVRDGYKIWGNIGDQWSDISGVAAGNRLFKLPNPLYFIP